MRNRLKLLLPGLVLTALTATSGLAEPVSEWPFTFEENLVWMNVQTGSRDSLQVILDSGATEHIVDIGVAGRIGVRGDGPAARVRSANSLDRRRFSKPIGIWKGEFPLANRSVLLVPLPTGDAGQMRLDGIVGLPLFRQFSVQIDYPESKIRLFATSAAPISPMAASVPLIFRDGLVGIEMKDANGRVGQFVLDTGSAEGVILGPAGREIFQTPAPGAEHTLFSSGAFSAYELPSSEWRLGGQCFSDVETLVTDGKVGGILADPRWAGSVGNAFLCRFRVTIDWAAGRLYLEEPLAPVAPLASPEFAENKNPSRS